MHGTNLGSNVNALQKLVQEFHWIRMKVYSLDLMTFVTTNQTFTLLGKTLSSVAVPRYLAGTLPVVLFVARDSDLNIICTATSRHRCKFRCLVNMLWGVW